jgi:hypothetical protein
MDRFDFDPAEHTLNQVVAFCKRMEAAEEQDTSSDRKVAAKTDTSSKKKGKIDTSGMKDRTCLYHGPNTHPTMECTSLCRVEL